MGTAPASTLRSLPEFKTVHTPEETSSPEKTKKNRKSDSKGEVLSAESVRSSKGSGHKKGTFAAAYRQALDKTLETPSEELDSSEIPANKARKKTSSEGSQKPSGTSRKKSRLAREAGESALIEIPGEQKTTKTDLLSRALPERPNQMKGVRWGPSSQGGGSDVSPFLAKTPVSPDKTLSAATAPPSRPSSPASLGKALEGILSRSRVAQSAKSHGESQKEAVHGGKEELSLEAARPSGKEKDAVPQGSLFREKDLLGGKEEAFSSPLPPSVQDKSIPGHPGPAHGPALREGFTIAGLASASGEGGGIAGTSSPSESATPVLPEGLQGRVGSLAREGGGAVSLDVRPPHLGPVGVRVHVDPHTRLVTVMLASHDPRIRHLLTEKEGSIKESLSQSGFVLDRFQVVSQPPSGLESLSMQDLSGGTPSGTSDGSGGFSGQSGSGTGGALAGGGAQGQDFGSLARQGSGAGGQEGGSEGFRGHQGPELPKEDGIAEIASVGGEGVSNTGYHRIA